MRPKSSWSNRTKGSWPASSQNISSLTTQGSWPVRTRSRYWAFAHWTKLEITPPSFSYHFRYGTRGSKPSRGPCR
jgi:hypothetical protein